MTPSIRIGPTFCALMKIAKSVAAAMKMAAGSLIGELGSGFSGGGWFRFGRGGSAGHELVNHPGVLAKLLLDPRHHSLDLGRKAKDDAGLHALGGGPPNDRRRGL